MRHLTAIQAAIWPSTVYKRTATSPGQLQKGPQRPAAETARVYYIPAGSLKGSPTAFRRALSGRPFKQEWCVQFRRLNLIT